MVQFVGLCCVASGVCSLGPCVRGESGAVLSWLRYARLWCRTGDLDHDGPSPGRGILCLRARLEVVQLWLGSEFWDGWMISRNAPGRRARREFSNGPGEARRAFFSALFTRGFVFPKLQFRERGAARGWCAEGVRASFLLELEGSCM